MKCESVNQHMYKLSLHRLDPERFLESIRTLLDNNADNAQFDAFFQLMMDRNVCTVYFCDHIKKSLISFIFMLIDNYCTM